LPELSGVVVALAVPVKVTVAPLPPVIVPEILQLMAEKLTAVTSPPLIVIARLGGLKVTPDLLGVTV
jgi:hypothetical protein